MVWTRRPKAAGQIRRTGRDLLTIAGVVGAIYIFLIRHRSSRREQESVRNPLVGPPDKELERKRTGDGEARVTLTSLRLYAGIFVLVVSFAAGVLSWLLFRTSAPPPPSGSGRASNVFVYGNGKKCDVELDVWHTPREDTSALYIFADMSGGKYKTQDYATVTIGGSAAPNIERFQIYATTTTRIKDFGQSGVQNGSTPASVGNDDKLRIPGYERVDKDDRFKLENYKNSVYGEGAAISFRIPNPGHTYNFAMLDADDDLIASGWIIHRDPTLSFFVGLVTPEGIEQTSGFRRIYTLPLLLGLGEHYAGRGERNPMPRGQDCPKRQYTTKLNFSSRDDKDYLLSPSLPGIIGGNPSSPKPNDRTEMAIPALRDPNEYKWVSQDMLSPVIGLSDRAGEQDAQRSLFVAGIGLSAAFAFLIWGLELLPWRTLLDRSLSRG
jgi:hypothetical protein